MIVGSDLEKRGFKKMAENPAHLSLTWRALLRANLM
jgi:hypothetical protein